VGDFSAWQGSTTATNIQIAALEEGADGSGLGTVGGPVELVDAIAGPSAHHASREDERAAPMTKTIRSISRLISFIRLMSPRPVMAQDFADLAQNVTGIWRAAAIEGLDANLSLTGQPQRVTVFPVTEGGVYVGDTIADSTSHMFSR
jgi:hypothetical protein